MKVKIIIIAIAIISITTIFSFVITNNTQGTKDLSQPISNSNSETKYIQNENTPFCTVEEKKECETNKSSNCCPFEID